MSTSTFAMEELDSREMLLSFFLLQDYGCIIEEKLMIRLILFPFYWES